jgi:hypothetical protein
LPHPVPKIVRNSLKQLAGELRGRFFAWITSSLVLLVAQAGNAIE